MRVTVSERRGSWPAFPPYLGVRAARRVGLGIALLATVLGGTSSGAEHFRCAGAPVGAHVTPKVAAKSALQGSGRETRNALVLFAKFRDELTGQVQVPSWSDGLFDPLRPGSFSHFYRSMSSGRHQVDGVVAPRRYESLDEAAAYLSPDPTETGDFGRFNLEILHQADQDIDFADFDNDGPDGIPDSGDDDGVVDVVFIVLASAPLNFLLGGATGIGNLGFVDEYLSDDHGITGSSIRILSKQGSIQVGRSYADAVGVMCHEYGHLLGLPDLFDVGFLRGKSTDPADDSAGIGRWGLMGWGALGWNGNDGPNAFSAWSLQQLGWIGTDNGQLVEVTGEATDLILEDVHAGGRVVRIPLRAGGPRKLPLVEEYLLLEQRTRDGSYYNRNIPAEGLLVWHARTNIPSSIIDERLVPAGIVDLVCADGLYRDAGFPHGLEADARQGYDNLEFWAHDQNYSTAHGGNLGDATDPFDGERFTRLGPDSNPSSDPRGLIPQASTKLTVQMQRRGSGMEVDVQPARWAGTLTGEVRWAGTVLVDGDLTVAAEAALVIEPGTRVLFAGSDRLRGGLDPELCELKVLGSIQISRYGLVSEKVVFSALVPGELWHGITLDLVDFGSSLLPASLFEVHDAQRGVQIAGYPEGCYGSVMGRPRFLDSASGTMAGNGDGLLSHGELFQVELPLTNCTLRDLRDYRVRLLWPEEFVEPAWIPDDEVSARFSASFETMKPGEVGSIRMPSLALRPGVTTGQQIELVAVWSRGSKEIMRDTLSQTVTGVYPDHQVTFAVPGRDLRGSSVGLPPDQNHTLRAHVAGDVEGVDMLLRRVPGLELVAEVSMATEDQGADRLFEVEIPRLGLGEYLVYLRLKGPEGRVFLSRARLFLWVGDFPEAADILVYLGEASTSAWKLRSQLQENFTARGQSSFWLESAPEDGGLYDALLPDYERPDRLVVWAGGKMDLQAQAAFRRLLQAGGRLLIISLELGQSYGIEPFLREVLHLQAVGANRTGTAINVVHNWESLRFAANYAPVTPIAPAESFLYDGPSGEAAGMRLDTGAYRVVYLSFDWPVVLRKDTGRLLVDAGMNFLLRQSTVEVDLSIPERSMTGLTVAAPLDGQVRVRAMIGEPVDRLDLIVRSSPSLKVLEERPMQLVETSGSALRFETTFLPPGPGEYRLAVRLPTTDGQTMLDPNGLRLISFSAEEPSLVLLGEQYDEGENAMLRSELGAIFAGLERPAGFMNLTDLDADALHGILRSYQASGRLVVWLGARMGSEMQAVFRSFLEGGGRLMLSSYWFFLQPASDLFNGELPQIYSSTVRKVSTVHATGLLHDPRLEFTVKHVPLTPLLNTAEPLFVNEENEPAALRLDQAGYRLVLLPFDIAQLPADPRRQVMEATLPFLLHRPVKLEVVTVVEPGTATTVETMRPELVIANTGNETSQNFRVGYQILDGETLLTTREQTESPLAPGQERRVQLPFFQPIGTGRLTIRFGVGDASDQALEYAPGRPLYVVEGTTTFDQVDIEEATAGGHGVGIFDFDGDGDLDLHLIRPGSADQLFVHGAHGWEEQGALAGLNDVGVGRATAIGDYDGDGDLDVYLVREGANRFYRNGGDGRFAECASYLDATAGGGSLADTGSGWGAGFLDSDGDGDLDLYLVNAGGTNRLYQNLKGQFAEVASAVGLDDAGDGSGLALGDYDGDGDTDLFVANDRGPGRLYRNEAALFRSVDQEVGLTSSHGASGAAFGDYDNDGTPDLLVAGRQGPNLLFRGLGSTFELASPEGGWHVGEGSRGIGWMDYDNDGDLDVVTTAGWSGAGGDQIYQNAGTHMAPVGLFSRLQALPSGQGLGFGDIDRDGDLDLFVAGAEGSRLYRNRSGEQHWLQVDLRGLSVNRYGLGARVQVVANGKRQQRSVQAAYGYGSQKGSRVHFGLGSASAIDTVRVLWPDGEKTEFTGVEADRLMTLRHPALPAAGEVEPPVPDVFQVVQNYPNPFNAGTTFTYRLPKKLLVTLTVYSATGQAVKRLVDDLQPQGRHQVRWDGTNAAGTSVASGVYLYRLRAGEFSSTRRLVLIK